MLANYLKITQRNILRNKVFSSVNIIGLALGLACSLLIMLWVTDERQKDAFHAHGDQLYYVFENQLHDGQIDAGYYTPGLLYEEMKKSLPEVELASPMAWTTTHTFEVNNKILKVTGNYAGADFFSMFSYPLIAGTAESALKTTSDIAISRKMAEDFFGSPEKAIGQSMRYENRKDLRVAAVYENVGANSSVKFDYMLNWFTFLDENTWAKEWGNNGPGTTFMLRKDADPVAFQKKLEPFLAHLYKDQSDNFKVLLHQQKYQDRYLHSSFKNGLVDGGRIQYVKLFSVVAVFILLIACINFMNLTTARSVKRAKEIGVRKVIGAFRAGLIRQFLSEAMFTVAAAVVVAILLAALVLPVFNSITQKQIVFPVASVSFWIGMLALTAVTGLLSGSYPALYLSSFRPVSVLKGTFNFSNGAVWFRKGLVVFQFTLSVVLIVGTVIVSQQVDYVQSTNLGYDRENLLTVPIEGELRTQYQVIKDRTESLPGVQLVSFITQSPASLENGTGGVSWEGKDPNSNLQFTQAGVEYDFIKTMGVTLLEGRDFSKDFVSDSSNYIINEKALAILGYKNPIGMPLTLWGKKGTIIGLIKDTHFSSLHTEIKPLILRQGDKRSDFDLVVVRTEAGKTKEALLSLEKLCKEINPQFPFTYSFLDDEYQKLYASEQVVQKLSNVFAFLAIFISCLGLLGLSMFTAEQRTKEVGIRKILGASSVSLFTLLSRELLILVLISLAIATPFSWFAMNAWLAEYAYKISIGWGIFVFAGAFAVIIALITVSFQTIKALVANPVNSLREQ